MALALPAAATDPTGDFHPAGPVEPAPSLPERVRQARSAMFISAAGFAIYLVNVGTISSQGWFSFDLGRAAPIIIGATVVDLLLAVTAGRWAGRRLPVYLIETHHAVALTLVLPALGGVKMGLFYIAYAFTIFHAEMVRSDASLFITANICAVCYAALALAELAGVGGWLAPQPLAELWLAPEPHVYRAFIVANFIILNVLVFFSRGYGHQLRYLAARLRETVAERTKELTHLNAELAEKARALEEKQEELRTFVYTVTHELKNPVNAALLTVDMVLERERDGISERSRVELERVLRLAERVEAMIVDLLGLFKIVSAPEAVGRVDLRVLVDDALEQLAPQIEAKAVQMHVGPLPAVRGQAGKLGHVVVNLLHNAVKHVPAEQGVVEVTGEVEGDFAVLRVRDNGIGMPERYQSQIFNLFWRVPDESGCVNGKRPGGSGVGLTIVKRIVDAHRGTVTVESQPGAGACFTVRLPLEAEA